jgi:NAD(P)-dependent dehydrogenase (short-subunit alcohol dehydrogenase family)
MSWSEADIPPLNGRVAMVTGAARGLGLATATALAAKGAHVVMAVRDPAATPTLDGAEIVELDLGSLASVEHAAGTVRDRHDRLDLLINNAGVMAVPEGRTTDGFETQFGVNHLGHWALTARLLPLLVRTPGARVVTATSNAQHGGRPLTARPPARYDPFRAYDDSKLANRHFAQGLDRRFRAAGLTTRSLAAHPGATDTGLAAHLTGRGLRDGVLPRFAARVGMSPARGALSQLRAATDPRAEGGTMYGPRWFMTGPPVARRLVRPGAAGAIEALWATSRELTGLDIDVAAAVART